MADRYEGHFAQHAGEDCEGVVAAATLGASSMFLHMQTAYELQDEVGGYLQSDEQPMDIGESSSNVPLTPPPDCNSPRTSLTDYQSPQVAYSAPADSFFNGSSLEETPVSSPSSCGGDREAIVAIKDELQINKPCSRPKSPLATRSKSSSTDTGDSGDEDVESLKNVKMPQRKGGMQLWQFLYTLLSDQDNKYQDMIEWTSNTKSREFRLLEPEAMAIWWGEHKNKKNMSYDKLSRSLRYYYDKNIIKKVPGERYVYQFCIDPERMYKHIGNSDSRPKLKPMPLSAKRAMFKYQVPPPHMFIPAPHKPFVAQGPFCLNALQPHRHPMPPAIGFNVHCPGQPSFAPAMGCTSTFAPPETSIPPNMGYITQELPFRPSFDSLSFPPRYGFELPQFMSSSAPSVDPTPIPPFYSHSPPMSEPMLPTSGASYSFGNQPNSSTAMGFDEFIGFSTTENCLPTVSPVSYSTTANSFVTMSHSPSGITYTHAPSWN